MSRYNYLLIILFILITGWILFNQLIFSVDNASVLIKREIKSGMNKKIYQFFKENKRSPDSSKEIKKLNELFISGIDKLLISNISDGNKFTPAILTYKFKTKTKEFLFKFIYFGCDYIKDYKKRGLFSSIALK